MMDYRLLRIRSGLTLMELMVSMAVATLVIGLGLQLYAETQRVIDRQQVKASRLGSETDLLSLLRRDIRGAAAIAPQSTRSRLVLVTTDGSRTEYQVTRDGVKRTGPALTAAVPEVQGIQPRFEYPAVAGRVGRVVQVSWDEGAARRSVVLHLRNEGAL